MNTLPSNLIDISEASRKYHVSKSFLYKKCAERAITCFKLGKKNYFSPEQLDDWFYKNSIREAVK